MPNEELVAPLVASKHRHMTETMYTKQVRWHLCFLIFCVVSVYVFAIPLRSLIKFSLSHDYGSHIVLVLPFSLYLIYLGRRIIFSTERSGFFVGLGVFLLGSWFYWMAQAYSGSMDEHSYLSLLILSLVTLWIAGFIAFYGTHAFTAALFPLLFLILMIPIPNFLIEKLTFFLQAGSAATAYWMLKLAGMPVFRKGFVLSLPGMNVVVAEECSGIRSSLALLITTVVAAQFLLSSKWRRFLFIISTIPILILKNGARIMTLSVLGIYVNQDFFHGWLHHSGGMLFYLLGLLMLVPVMTSLRKSEASHRLVHDTRIACWSKASITTSDG